VAAHPGEEGAGRPVNTGLAGRGRLLCITRGCRQKSPPRNSSARAEVLQQWVATGSRATVPRERVGCSAHGPRGRGLLPRDRKNTCATPLSFRQIERTGVPFVGTLRFPSVTARLLALPDFRLYVTGASATCLPDPLASSGLSDPQSVSSRLSRICT
jgi:hypothetical protein